MSNLICAVREKRSDNYELSVQKLEDQEAKFDGETDHSQILASTDSKE